MQVVTIDPRECIRWKLADRNSFEFGDTNFLAEDIRRNGQIEPVFVRKLNSGKIKYEVIAGSRRFQACLNANLSLKAIVTDISDIEAAIIQIKENENLTISEYSKGISYSKLQKELNISQTKLAELVGCTRHKIISYLYFSKIDQSIWNAVANMSKVSAKSAKTIYLLSKKSQQHKEALIDIAEEIKKGAGSRRIERLVNNIVLGEKQTYSDETIQSSDGTIFASWKNDKLQFSKNSSIDRKELSKHLLDFFVKKVT